MCTYPKIFSTQSVVRVTWREGRKGQRVGGGDQMQPHQEYPGRHPAPRQPLLTGLFLPGNLGSHVPWRLRAGPGMWDGLGSGRAGGIPPSHRRLGSPRGRAGPVQTLLCGDGMFCQATAGKGVGKGVPSKFPRLQRFAGSPRVFGEEPCGLSMVSSGKDLTHGHTEDTWHPPCCPENRYRPL